MMSDRRSNPQSAEDAAAFWFARLRADTVSSRDRRRFERWLEQSSENKEAYAANEAVWDMARDAATDAAFMTMRKEALAMTPVAPGQDWRKYAALAASVLIAVFAGFLLFPDVAGNLTGDAYVSAQGDRLAPLVYRTAVGQRSTVSLADGSIVELNTDSRIEIEYDGEQRRIVLHRGQALFDVARDQTRPFVVEADDKLITAHGTSFDVRRSGHEIQVTLLEGRVTVEREKGILSYFAEPDRQALEPGDQLVAVGEQPFQVRNPDVRRVVSWRDGLLIFIDEPLGDVVSEINRYSLRKVVLGEESMKELRVGGVFRPGSVGGFTSALETAFPLASHIDENRNVVVLEWSERPPP